MPSPATSFETVVARLRDLILRGEFAAGERLTEIRLAERLGVSRTPVRLALSELEHAGLVQPLPGGGYAMRAFTTAEVRDAMTVRGTLEGLAARLAAERGVPSDVIAALRGCLADGDRALAGTDRPDTGDAHAEQHRAAYATVNERFHRLIAHASGNRALMRAITHNNDLPFAAPNAMLPVRAAVEENAFWLRVAHQQHHAIVDAIEAREGGRAQALAEEHARAGRRALERAAAAPTRWKRLLPGLALPAEANE